MINFQARFARRLRNCRSLNCAVALLLCACGGGGGGTASETASASTVDAPTSTPTPTPTSSSTSATDLTAAILANTNVVLAGDSAINLPTGTTTYSGILSGAGTLHINAPGGSGTLILTGDSTFALPAAAQTETATQTKSPTDPNHVHYWVIHNPNPPAVTISAGATLQLGTAGSSTGSIGSYLPNTAGATINLDNFEVDGTLILPFGPAINLGVLSGTGVIQRLVTGSGGAVHLVGDNPFSGSIWLLHEMYFGNDHIIFSMPNATILTNESLITSAPQGQFGDTAGHELKYSQNIWESHYGSDINTDSGVVIFGGVYSYSDSGNLAKPSLSNPLLNTMQVKNAAGSPTGGTASSYRGVNVEGGTTQWGDGTTSAFFLPSAPSPAAPGSTIKNAYVNLHNDATLVFDYNGRYSFNVGIGGGGGGPDTDGSTGTGNLTLAATPGNYAVLTMPQNYNGVTTIGAGATLQLGNGSPVTASQVSVGAPTVAEPGGAILSTTVIATYSGDSSLLTAQSTGGLASDAIVDNGVLRIDNTTTAITLSNISGSGSLTQAGTATTTLQGNRYTGGTTVQAGVLAAASSDALGLGAVSLKGGVLTLADGQTTLAIGGALTETSTAQITLGIQGANPDQITVAGAATLAGTLNLSFTGSHASGQVLTLLTATGGVSGAFATTNSTGAAVTLSYDSTHVYATLH